jgi:basic membrane lipoprotein Med (substrate-binding protein (PBP1-ABC) superfamily)
VSRGPFPGGVFTYGLAEGGVGWVHGAATEALASEAARERVEQLRADIVAGKIHVEVR